jgi:hypothetical protein
MRIGHISCFAAGEGVSRLPRRKNGDSLLNVVMETETFPELTEGRGPFQDNIQVRAFFPRWGGLSRAQRFVSLVAIR